MPSSTDLAAAGATLQPKLVGARVKRREDPRLLTGGGRYVDDIVLPGMVEAAFVRSPHAHAEIVSINVDGALALDGVHAVLTGEDVAPHCKPITADLVFDEWQGTQWPVLARDRVRYVGEAVAVVVADDRYLAEDALDFIEVEYRPLPALTSIAAALAPDAEPLHEGWTSNSYIDRHLVAGDPDAAFRDADGVVELDLRMNRSSGIPLECRGVIGEFDVHAGSLTVWTSSQIPSLSRTGIADFLGMPEHLIRVVAPDVGGGFGVKAVLYPEELVIAVAAKLVGRPVKWIEDRQEHMLTSVHAREQEHRLSVAYREDGTIVGIRAEILVDCGAYSHWPWTSAREASMAASMMPGPYRIGSFECRSSSAATNKCFFGAYRGVARPAACLAHERAIDQVAHRLGMDRLEIRRRNYVRPEDFPYESITGVVYDSGSFIESLETVAREADYEGLKRRVESARAEGRYLGIGFAAYTEQTAHGTSARAKRGSTIVSGFESALVRMDPSGFVTVRLSTHNHGQGHATTIGQIVADELSIPLEHIRVEDGDTARAPYGHGTFASRSAVMAGGAALQSAQKVNELLREIAAHELEVDTADLELRDGSVVVVGSPTTGIPVGELARWAYHRPDKLPPGMQSLIESTNTYGAEPGPGTFSNAAHLVLLDLDVETGAIKLLDYWVAEDCGTMINPLIVDGQVHGGVAQGIGGALMEEFVYDDAGQLTTTTLKDYRLVGTTDVPPIHVAHLETKSPLTRLGIKGMGEGGTIAPYAAIASAVQDAISPLGHVVVNEVPLTPERVRGFIARARAESGARPAP